MVEETLVELKPQIFCNVNNELNTAQSFIELREFLETQETIPLDSIFLIDRPIMSSFEYEYSYRNGFLLLIKNHRIMFLTTEARDNELFQTFKDDFLEESLEGIIKKPQGRLKSSTINLFKPGEFFFKLSEHS